MAIMYKKFEPCDYILLIKNGKVIKEGQGLTVLCDNMRTNILAVPATAVDTAFAFDDLVTEDFQNVCLHGAITYIIKDYKRVIRMADFGYTRAIREKQMQGLAILNKRINNVVQAIVIRETGLRKVRDIIKQADEMATLIGDGLKNDEVIENLGIEILAVNVLGIQAKAETRKALEAVAREEILKQQDDAIYKRRNAAIEQERIIKENELNTEIKVAEKEREKGEKKIETKIMLEERNKELSMDYSELVSKIQLLISSGMTIRGSIERIVKDYKEEAGAFGRKKYVYEELSLCVRKIQDGMDEGQAYELFGRRCSLMTYKKLSALLTQNLKKGTDGLIEALSTEVKAAFEDRKMFARKMGEEAQTKLIFPMILMLGVVIMIIMVPAYMSFGA